MDKRIMYLVIVLIVSLWFYTTYAGFVFKSGNKVENLINKVYQEN